MVISWAAVVMSVKQEGTRTSAKPERNCGVFEDIILNVASLLPRDNDSCQFGSAGVHIEVHCYYTQL